jgi:Flp pilus assembly protein TadG
MLRSFPSLFRRLKANDTGSSALEFGFVAPILVLAVLGIMELGMILFVTSLLEGSVRTAARFGITGYAPASVSREQQIRDILEENTAGLIDMSQVTFTQYVYENFADIGKPEPYVDDSPANGNYDVGESYQDVNGNGQWDSDMGIAGVGGPGAVVIYRVNYDWPLLTPYLADILGEGGKIPLSASIVVRNEPFPET